MHRARRIFERHEEANCGFFARDDVCQISHHRDTYFFSALHRNNHFLWSFSVIIKENQSIYSRIGTLFLSTIRLGVYQRTSPPLKLIFISLSEIASALIILRRSVDLELYLWKSVFKS